MRRSTATALIAAGVLSVMIFPAAALSILRRAGDETGDVPAQSGAL
jgi:poly(3-hydroxybutyrate) depolymerase